MSKPCENCGRQKEGIEKIKGVGIQIHCKFYNEFIWPFLFHNEEQTEQQKEVFKWRVFYWKVTFLKKIETCGSCYSKLKEFKELREYWDEEKRFIEELAKI